jgi:hypothetical protein
MHTRELLLDKVRNKAWTHMHESSMNKVRSNIVAETFSVISEMQQDRGSVIISWRIKQNINFQIEEDLENAYT